mmetsp:Transcript_47132/g.47571  ORF Transcript_47132/g.47571 Transcript_47132/m.47571 type:complete len:164 (-) Transcript_47132:150-641(-)
MLHHANNHTKKLHKKYLIISQFLDNVFIAPGLSCLRFNRRIEKQNKIEKLRFDMTGLQMSDRVKKLFDLSNGNQYEVIKVQKERGMKLFERRDGDTGSSAVQVIALTTRIQQLQTHIAKHRKDHSTKRGLNALYVRRRKLLDYMERKEFDSYRRVVKTLGLIR